MADTITFELDDIAFLAAVGAVGEAVESAVHDAAGVTAGRIASEARGRVQRRTGRTAAAITVAEGSKPLGGFLVFVGDAGGRPERLPAWLNYGTRNMSGSQFMTNAARLEAGSHERRIAAAVQQGIDSKGLGDG